MTVENRDSEPISDRPAPEPATVTCSLCGQLCSRRESSGTPAVHFAKVEDKTPCEGSWLEKKTKKGTDGGA